MDIVNLLNDKTIKSIKKREEIIKLITTNVISIDEIISLKNTVDDKKMVIVLEALEDITRNTPEITNINLLIFAQELIISDSNSIKREASRIVGNISHIFPNNLEVAINNLIQNTSNEGTVIRWGSAYALAKIIQIPKYANSNLYNTLESLYGQESENGVKNKFLDGLKKAKKLRK